MPHAGRMRLIERIVSVGADTIHCVAADHRDPDYPLRLDGVLYGASLVEIGAQAAAAHVSLHGVEGAHTGLVLAISNAEILQDRVAGGGPLEVRAWRIQARDDAASYRFEVRDGSAILVAADVLLSLQRRTI